ncbi:MAG: cupin-like domain-containing protein [Pseudomonadota bacterium]
MTRATLSEYEAIDREMFRTRIVASGRPAILRGVARDWTVVQTGDDIGALTDYLKAGSGPMPVNVIQGRPGTDGRYFYDASLRGFNFDRGQVPLDRLIDVLIDPDAPLDAYMGSTPLEAVLPRYVQDFPMPLVPDGVGGRVWIGGASHVSTHYDQSHNIACVGSGRRIFTLYAPDQTRNLYPGPIEHTIAGPQMSMVDLSNPDPERFPRFSDAEETALTATLEPGDGLYIPPLWWHRVQAEGRLNVLVNYWWNDRPELSRPPMEAFVLALLSLRQLPDAERMAWRELFDYFIFQMDGPPMDHLPDEIRGVLGPISPQRAQAIWGHFTQLMSQNGA